MQCTDLRLIPKGKSFFTSTRVSIHTLSNAATRALTLFLAMSGPRPLPTATDGQHAWSVEGVSGPSAARTATGRLYCARRKSASPVAPCSGLQVAQSRRAVICCSAACLPQLDRLPRFGVEVFLKALWISSARRLAVVRWDGVESPSKSSKHGLVQGITGDLGMLRDILQTVGIKTAAQQIMRLRRQRVRP